jgi:hypothetical protein
MMYRHFLVSEMQIFYEAWKPVVKEICRGGHALSYKDYSTGTVKIFECEPIFRCATFRI